LDWLEVPKLNNKGQFSIIAALLVAVILVASVAATYSAIRYSPVQNQPQILSAIDETNLALKQILGFTIGYYGSVTQVTGNSSYAQTLATNYFESGLDNIADINPEWGASFNVANLSLGTNWFTNASYSQANLNITYDLTGLGIYGIVYSASCRLDVQISPSSANNQVSLTVIKDENTPLVGLSSSNFKFYLYQYSNLTWATVNPPDEPISSSNGTYTIDIPSGINPQSYAIQVQDSRGITVAASSFSHYTGSLVFNSSIVSGGNFVNQYNSSADSIPDQGTHSNFTAQQQAPSGIYDSITEATAGVMPQPRYPNYWNPVGSTTCVSGTTNDLQSINGICMSLQSYASSYSGSANFGCTTQGGSNSNLGYVRGSRFMSGTSSGLANSISVYLGFTSSNNNFGNTNTGTSGTSIIDTMRGQRFTTPSSLVVAQSISAYIYCTTSAKNMKASIYDSNGNLISSTTEKLVPSGSSATWQTFNFASPPTLTASTQYMLVVWSQTGSGDGDLRYSSSSGGNGRYISQSYGSWPSPATFSTNSYQYSIYCNYLSAFKAQAAIFSSNGATLIGTTEEKTLTTVNGWVTFNFISQPTLIASTNYVLAIEASDSSNVNIYYASNTAEYFRNSISYPTWPASLIDQGSQRMYSIYCHYSTANQYTAQAEFTGSASASGWNDLIWAIDSSTSTSGVAATFQLYNWVTGKYPNNGDGFMTATLGTSGSLFQQTITTNPSNFLNSTGYWRLMITATKSTTTSFNLNLDMVKYSPDVPNYALNMQEQWTNVNTTYLNSHPILCLNVGSGSAGLAVDAWNGARWLQIANSLSSGWNNISISSYFTSPNFTIRFRAGNSTTQNSWNIGAALLRPGSDQDLFLSLQNPAATVAVELLQNGTIVWLGQNLQLNTQAIPIPPIPVKAIHVNETIDGVNQQVPFQIEDWASSYTVPLGLTSPTTVFGNRQMVVFLVNTHVSAFTLWWNGSDQAIQTPLAASSTYFTGDNPSSHTLTNGILTLSVSTDGKFTVTSSTGSGSTCTTSYMRVNNQASTYGAGEAYVIYHGVVRDIIQQEAEWSNGITNCPNLYSNIVLTLPANATYFTYQLNFMFMNSQQTRTISDLCPIALSSSIGQLQTENGTILGDPVIVNGTQTLGKSSGIWAHHWSQFTDGIKGAGIMFTDQANQMLYTFDAMSPATTRGALKADSTAQAISILPVTLNQVSFQTPEDITWYGAVATFDGSTLPIYGGYGLPGLWVLAELPPTLTISVGN
jgi:hypothetical protein